MGIFKRKEVKPNSVVVAGANMANNMQDALGAALGVEPKAYYQEQPQQAMPQQAPQPMQQQPMPQHQQYYQQPQPQPIQSQEDELIETVEVLREMVTVLDQRLTFLESKSFRRGL